MRILVDQDDVIASWGEEYDRQLDAFGEQAAGIPRSRGQRGWDLNEGRTATERGIIRKVMTAPGFYAALQPVPGAKAALKAALEAGHDVRIVSAPYTSNPTCASDKLNWISRHYGSHWAKRLVLTNDKTLVHGDVLIDDKPEISGSMTPTWEHIVFDRPHNHHVTSKRRIIHWEEDTLINLATILERREA